MMCGHGASVFSDAGGMTGAGIPPGCDRFGDCDPVVSLVPRSTTGYMLGSLRLL